jgi:nucleoside-triphosphatase THEP1
MVGIFLEGLAVELLLTLTFGSVLGCILAGSVAVSLTLAQKITNLLITFGLDFVELYYQLYEFVLQWLKLGESNPLNLIVLLFLLHSALGATAGAAGVLASRAARKLPEPALPGVTPSRKQDRAELFQLDAGQRFSVFLFFLNLFSLIALMVLLDRLSWILALLVVLAYVCLAIMRYRRSLRRLMRPILWVQLVLVLTLSGLLLGNVGAAEWNYLGLMAGFRMTLRGIVMIIGFSILSVELRNPRILSLLTQKVGPNLICAIETGFQSLPLLIQAIGRKRRSWSHPLQETATLIRLIDSWLQPREGCLPQNTVILTGERAAGKSSLLLHVLSSLRSRKFKIGGFVSPSVVRGGRRIGYDLVSAEDETRIELCRNHADFGTVRQGPFYFSQMGLNFGNRLLSLPSLMAKDFIVIDEVGPLEMKGLGWAPALEDICSGYDSTLLLVVRRELVEPVIRQWNLENVNVIDVEEGEQTILCELLKILLPAALPIEPARRNRKKKPA